MGIFQSRIRCRIVSPDTTDESDTQIYTSKNNNRNTVINSDAVLKQKGYDLFDTIGIGAYAVVKQGYSQKRKENVAVKIVDQNRIPREVKTKFLPRELEITTFAEHENIIQCFEVIKAGWMVYMILEMIENGDLLSYVVKNDFIEEKMAKQMFKGIASAINFLHENNITHRDLKLENILLSENLVPKLSDFGFARVSENATLCRTYCGSATYAPLEITLGIPYDPFKVDIWCLGVILYAMTIGYMPFSDEKRKKQIKRGVSFRDTKQPITRQLKNLIKSILIINANARPTIGDVVSHEWLQQESVENVCML